MRSAIALSILMSSVAAASTAPCVAPDPLATARYIHDERRLFYADEGASADFISPPLYKLLKRDWQCQSPGDICAIEADPWVNAQDGDVLGPIEYRELSNADGRAVVRMDYRFGFAENGADAQSQSTSLVLVQDATDHCWRIDDLRVNDDPSLKQILEAFEFYED